MELAMRSPDPVATTGYTAAAKLLHWGMAALLIGQFTVAWTMPHIGRNTVPGTLINLHFSLGMLILLVAVARLAWRWTHREPAPLDGVPPWQVQSARVVHVLLYVLLLALPVLGWINASWRGFDVSVFGLFAMPKLVATRAAGIGWTGDVHALLSNWVLTGLVGLHVLAALYHAAVRKDRVLARMLPAGW
jgi:cytochrome b561